AYQRFLLYLYFPSRIDTESGQTSIPRAVVAHCEGVDPKKVESNNYCARDFFLRFRRDVMPSFSWKKHERGKRSRTVARADLNLELQQKALSLDPATSRERVFVDTGEAWTPQKQRELSRQIKAKANASAKYALCDDQR